ncbi:hypothetical protein AB4037_14060 [Labrys sp. KB_33_2]|uniref:hypothetical protein n=1 Tax=Labrys sp. KB_33_2 TaxID=3237479 RepID=UPI003F901CE7
MIAALPKSLFAKARCRFDPFRTEAEKQAEQSEFWRSVPDDQRLALMWLEFTDETPAHRLHPEIIAEFITKPWMVDNGMTGNRATVMEFAAGWLRQAFEKADPRELNTRPDKSYVRTLIVAGAYLAEVMAGRGQGRRENWHYEGVALRLSAYSQSARPKDAQHLDFNRFKVRREVKLFKRMLATADGAEWRDLILACALRMAWHLDQIDAEDPDRRQFVRNVRLPAA